MSSLYYQHQHHEQQRHQQHQEQQHRDQLRMEHEKQQHQHYQYHSHHQSQSQHHSQHYHYHESRSHPSSDPSFPHNQRISNDSRGSHGEGYGEHKSQDCRSSPSSMQLRIHHPSRDETLDSLMAMMSQERSGYVLDSYFPPEVLPKGNGLPRQQNIIHGGWREKICQWSYNVVDHFDLPREIVSISLNYFDRYMATLSTAENRTKNYEGSSHGGRSSPKGSGDLALLASLGTLHLATKVHATNHNDYDPALGPLEEQHHKVPSLSTLANLSRGQFGPASILEMEKLLLGALRWRLHPPTLYAFVSLLLKLLPTLNEDPRFGLKQSIASELFEVAMYVAELSVCDAFFVERQIPSSTIALAAICTAMDDLMAPEDSSIMAGLGMGTDATFLDGSGCFTEHHRSLLMATCEEHLGMGKRCYRFEESLERLRSMYLGASALKNQNGTDENGDAQMQPPPSQQQQQQQQRPRTNSYNPPTSPSSIADMSLSTINSNIHSMADTNGGGSSSLKRGDSMISSIACQSKETLTTNDADDDDLFGGITPTDTMDQHSDHQSLTDNNFRYSPSPPREDGAPEALPSYDHNIRRNPRAAHSLVSCSPIVALR